MDELHTGLVHARCDTGGMYVLLFISIHGLRYRCVQTKPKAAIYDTFHVLKPRRSVFPASVGYANEKAYDDGPANAPRLVSCRHVVMTGGVLSQRGPLAVFA